MYVYSPLAQAPDAGHGRFNPERTFVEHYAAMRNVLREHAMDPGVAVFAFDGGRAPLGSVWLPADEYSDIQKLVIGRHSACGLRLDPEDRTVALRHLLLLARPRKQGVLVRLIDLQTGMGFCDEDGKTLESVMFDGPAFFSVKGVVLVLLPTGGGIPRHNAHEAWAEIPSRFVFDERETSPRFPVRQPEGVTMIRSVVGPRMARGDLGAGGLAGRLWLKTADGESRVVRVGWDALNEGVLIGRYSRCGVQVSNREHQLSRVHVLLIEDEGALLAIDTGSSNGTWEDGQEISAVYLSEGTELLAGDLSLYWSFESEPPASG